MKNIIDAHWDVKITPYKLNLDLGFDPLVSKFQNLEYKSFTFKGGEPHFQIITPVEYVGDLFITQRYNDVKDLVDIIIANDSARRMGFKNITLVLPYFPAARQDRVCNDGEPLTIKVFADMINSCGFNSVIIMCPHSEVTPALINNVVVLDELQLVERAVASSLDGHQYNIVCPDAGAGKRVGQIVKHLSHSNDHVKFNLIRCEKVRDVRDGSITEFFVQADSLHGYPTLICDDIVCGGNTFIGLGDVLKSKNCGKLMLFVTHADYVEGVQRMIEYFDHVYLTNSKRDWDKYKYTFDEKLTCFKISI